MTTPYSPNAGLLLANLPTDLRVLIDEASLLKLTLHSAAEAEGIKRISGTVGRVRWSGPMMLTLISYSYVIGIYGSRDIESAITKDKTLRYICARQYPTWEEIRRFRRLNRDCVQRTLASVLTQVCVHYFWPNYPDVAAHVAPADIDEQIRLAALGRIETAIIMDAVDSEV